MAETNPPSLPVPVRPRAQIRVVRVVGRVFRVWITTLPQLLLVATLVHAPLVPLRWIVRDAEHATSWRGVTARAMTMVEIALTETVVALSVHVVLQRLRGDAPELGRSIARGLRRIGTIFGITVILNAPYGAYVLLDSLFSAPADATLSSGPSSWILLPLPPGTSPWMLVPLAFTVFIWTFLCAPTPVAIVEGRGVLASIGRSWILTDGNRTAIFVVYALFGVLWFFVGNFAPPLVLPGRGSAAFALDVAGDLLASSFFAVVFIVLYHELSESQEDVGGERLVQVFK